MWQPLFLAALHLLRSNTFGFTATGERVDLRVSPPSYRHRYYNNPTYAGVPNATLDVRSLLTATCVVATVQQCVVEFADMCTIILVQKFGIALSTLSDCMPCACKTHLGWHLHSMLYESDLQGE